MMSYINRIAFTIGIVTTIGLIPACNQFETFNENPNEPTVVSPDVLFTSGVRNAVNTMVTESFLLGNNIGQLTAKTLRTEVDAYNWNAFPTVWEGLYESLTDILAVEEIARQTGNNQMEGAAKVVKAWIFATLTNAYGDIPYFNAIKGAENNFTPAYDGQDLIYEDLLAQLNEARTLLGGSGSISGDPIYNGDSNGWIKLANGLSLRLLMTGGEKIPNAASQFATIASSGNLITQNADNAALTYLDGFPNQYPLIPIKTGDFDAVAISQTALQVLNTYKDPRLMRYARPDNDDFTDITAFAGAVNGSNSANCSKIGSRLGVSYWDDPTKATASSLGLPMAEGLIMTSAETHFLLAEGIALGWIEGDLESLYKGGIEASMEYYQVELAPFGWVDFEDFYNNSGVMFSETTDIWKQKWLALFFNGLEPYFEVRRWYKSSGMSWDGIPFLSAPCENLNNDQLPLRFLYPGQEQSLNAANYEAAVSKLGGNNQNAAMWLMQ
jgi:hypothetical protein